MIVLKDLSSMTPQQLKAVTRAVYIVHCTNKAFSDLYSCGAAGIRQGQSGNLFQRLDSHARDWRSHVQQNGSQLYRHRVSPFGTRVWALHLVGWSGLGVQLAEHALHFRLSLAFPFVDASCFLARSSPDVLKVVEAVIPDLRKIAAVTKSTLHKGSAVLKF